MASIGERSHDGSVAERRAELQALIAERAAMVHSLEAEIVDAFAELIDLDGTTGPGYRSPAHWLSIHTNYTMRDAREITALAERAQLIGPLLDDARDGKVSVGVLASAARVAHQANLDALRETISVTTPTQLLRTLRTFRHVVNDLSNEPTEHDADLDPIPATWWRHWTDHAGRYRLDAALDAATGALLEAARGAAAHDDGCDSVVDPVAGLAAAALDGFESAGCHSPDGGRFRVQVSCDLETLAAALGVALDPKRPVGFGSRAYLPATGAHLTDAELSRLACGAQIQFLIHHDGVPLWLGRSRRSFSSAQQRAMLFRAEGQCEFPGCENTRWLHGHHAIEVSKGGCTDITNGVVLCATHHRELHRHGWTVRRRGRHVEWFDPDGRPLHAPRFRAVDPAAVPLPDVEPIEPSPDAGTPLGSYTLDVLLHELLAA